MREPYDIVLMDIQMPEMDGLAATQAIRTGMVRANIPIVALTANALPTERGECFANLESDSTLADGARTHTLDSP
jgi:CheY-like chemotaxis protein